ERPPSSIPVQADTWIGRGVGSVSLSPSFLRSGSTTPHSNHPLRSLAYRYGNPPLPSSAPRNCSTARVEITPPRGRAGMFDDGEPIGAVGKLPRQFQRGRNPVWQHGVWPRRV